MSKRVLVLFKYRSDVSIIFYLSKTNSLSDMNGIDVFKLLKTLLVASILSLPYFILGFKISYTLGIINKILIRVVGT